MTDVYYYPENLKNQSLNPAFIQLSYFERDDKDRLTPKSIVCLGMPDGIKQPSTVSWDNEKFGMGGKLLADTMKKMTGDGQGTMDINSMTSAVAERVKQAAMFNIAATAGKTVLGSTASAEGLMGDVGGKIPNPYVTAIFRGINFRTFSFTFRFTPLKESDCVLIDDIIRTMRANSLSESLNDTAFLSYPYECQMVYFWKGKENKWLNKFKRAACTSIDVDYTGSGSFNPLRNGCPSQIVINTTWTELDLVTRQDVVNGF